MRMTMDSVCKIGFGVDQRSLRADLPQVSFIDAFQRMGKLVQTRQIGPMWKLRRALNIAEEREMGQLRKDMDKFLYNIIKDRKVEIESLQNEGQLKVSLIPTEFLDFHYHVTGLPIFFNSSISSINCRMIYLVGCRNTDTNPHS